MKKLLFAFALLVFALPFGYAGNPKADKASAVVEANKANPEAAAAAQERFDSFQLAATEQRGTDVPLTEPAASTFWAFIVENWGKIIAVILALWEIIARATPSERDNTLLTFLKRILDSILPNRT